MQANFNPSPSYAFGIRHSPYIGNLKGDDWVSAKTETRSYPVATTTTKQEAATVSCNGVPVVKKGSVSKNTARKPRVTSVKIWKSIYFN